MGWSSQAQIAQLVIIEGNADGLFVYSGTPAAGNLIGSIVPAAGTDQYGNTYLPGVTDYNQIAGGAVNAVQMNQGQLTFSQAPSPSGAFTAWGTIDGFGLGVLEVTSALNVDSTLTVNGEVTFGTVPATLNTDGSGYPQFSDNAGLLLWASGSKQASVNTANVTTTANSSLGFMTVPAGDVVQGSTYEGHASGSFDTGSSVPSSATFRVYWGGIAGTIIASAAMPVIPANASGLSWFMDFEANWMSTTEVEVTLTVGWRSGAGISNSQVYYVVAQATGLSTGGNENLSMAFQWGSAPGGQQLLCDVSRLGRIA